MFHFITLKSQLIIKAIYFWTTIGSVVPSGDNKAAKEIAKEKYLHCGR